MSHHESTAKGPDGRMVDRMLFFSDAVFAIVLTIMVLELRAPVLEDKALTGAASAQALLTAIMGEGRTIFAYVVSFGIVTLWWSVHMRVTRSMHRFDWPTAICNMLFLFTVTIIPFAAAVLGENVRNDAAWAIYWSINAAASLTLTVMMIVVSRGGGRLIGGMDATERLARVLQSAGPGLAFAIGAWASANGQEMLSRFCWLFMLPVMILSRFLYRKATAHKEEAPEA